MRLRLDTAGAAHVDVGHVVRSLAVVVDRAGIDMLDGHLMMICVSG